MRKIPFAGIELASQRVRGYMVPLSYRGDRFPSINTKVFPGYDIGGRVTRRENFATLYKEWYRLTSKRFIKPPYSLYRKQPRSTRIVVACPRPALSVTKRTNHAPISFVLVLSTCPLHINRGCGKERCILIGP